MKQILHILTKLLYMGLNDCAWKITRISIENQCRIIAYFEPDHYPQLDTGEAI